MHACCLRLHSALYAASCTPTCCRATCCYCARHCAHRQRLAAACNDKAAVNMQTSAHQPAECHLPVCRQAYQHAEYTSANYHAGRPAGAGAGCGGWVLETGSRGLHGSPDLWAGRTPDPCTLAAGEAVAAARSSPCPAAQHAQHEHGAPPAHGPRLHLPGAVCTKLTMSSCTACIMNMTCVAWA